MNWWIVTIGIFSAGLIVGGFLFYVLFVLSRLRVLETDDSNEGED